MIRKLLAIAVLALLPLSATTRANAEDPPPADSQGAESGAPAADDPDGQPYPPDGVAEPDAAYPTDGAGDTTDQGEAGAVPPDDAPLGDAPADGSSPPD